MPFRSILTGFLSYLGLFFLKHSRARFTQRGTFAEDSTELGAPIRVHGSSRPLQAPAVVCSFSMWPRTMHVSRGRASLALMIRVSKWANAAPICSHRQEFGFIHLIFISTSNTEKGRQLKHTDTVTWTFSLTSIRCSLIGIRAFVSKPARTSPVSFASLGKV